MSEYEVPEEPSKSQRKREAHAVLTLAEELLAMSASVRQSIPLPDDIRKLIEKTSSIRSHIARKRETRFLAKQLRNTDLEPVYEALEALRNEARGEAARLHLLESWRDRLLEEGDAAVMILCEKAPAVDRQKLRQLIRQASKEQAAGKPPAAARKIFRMLREFVSALEEA